MAEPEELDEPPVLVDWEPEDEVAVTKPELEAVALLEVESEEESSVDGNILLARNAPIVDRASCCEESLSILTNCVAVALAGVGVELQGLLGLVTALVRDAGLDLLRVVTADGREIGRVGSVAGKKGSGQFHGRRIQGPPWYSLPDDGEDTGRGLVGGDEAGEGNKGQGESRLLEEHVDRIDGNK